MLLPESHRRRWITLNVSIAVYMSTLDSSVVSISLPTIIQSLNTQVKEAAWVFTAYLISITGCLLLMGRLADLFGQRRVYILGFLIFTIGSALCGLSPTVYFLIGSRILQGLGASALMAIGPAIITTAYPEEERGKALGMIGAVVSAGFLTGPIVGGFLVEHLGWRSVFFINLPIGAIGLFLSSKVLSETGVRDRKPIDFKGVFLLFFFIASLLLFLNRMGLGWLFSGSICFLLFIVVESRSPFPLVDLRLFREHLFAFSLGTSFLSFWMAASHTFVTPFFLQNILGFSPSKVGMLVFPVSLSVMVFAPIGGKISDRVGVRIPATVGLILSSATIFSFIFLNADAGDYEILWRQVVLGIGIGLFNPANNSAVIGSLPREMAGLTSSFLAVSRNLGMAVGVAFAETVIAFRQSPSSLEVGKGIPSLENIHDVWKLAVIVGVIAVLLSGSRRFQSRN